MVVVVVTFALCWLPYHIYFILGSFNSDIYKQHYIQQVSSCLFMSSNIGLNYLLKSHFRSLSGVLDHILVSNEFNHVQSHHLLLSKPKVRKEKTSSPHKHESKKPTPCLLCRFRAGFRHAFSWCPFIKVSEEDKMELQHTHTFRVTMTRSHRNAASYTRTSIKTNNTHDSLKSEQNTCIQLKGCTPSKTHNTCKTYVTRRPDDTKSQAAKLMEPRH